MNVLCPLGQAELGLAGQLQYLARASEYLPGDKERDQLFGDFPKVHVPAHQKILVTAVGVAERIGVVLEDIDLTGEAFFAQAFLGGRQARFEQALTRLVVDHQIFDVVTLRGGIFGMTPGVLVEPSTVHQEGVRRPAIGDEAFEDIAENFFDRQIDPPVRREDQAVFVLKAEDARLHDERSVRSSEEGIRLKVRPCRPRSSTATSSPSGANL